MSFLEFIRKARKSILFMVGFWGFLLILLVCLLGPLVIPWNPTETDLMSRFAKPQWFSLGLRGHILGCDYLGRDILARAFLGGQASLLISILVMIISCGIGFTVGTTSGFFGGKIDTVLMRICDIVLAVPALLLALVVVAVLGSSFANLIITLSIGSWAMMARIVRSTTLGVRNQEYVNASKILGASRLRTLMLEVVPNASTPMIINISQRIGGTILAETSMSFLGCGVPVPMPSWGGMIADGRSYISTYPFVVVVPGIFLMITVLTNNFLGDGLRDILDPRNKD
jgi:ABC-type dipeptide/oligopeptide/nickel transport system permease subunit